MRTTKAPAQRAQEALDVVTRQLDRANARYDKAKVEFEAAAIDVNSLTRRQEYLAQNPDLPTPNLEPDVP